MARRKKIDLSQMHREDVQADGFSGEAIASLGREEGGVKTRRVESLPLSLIVPDRYQPRPLLPSWIRARFFAGEISCYDAARSWLDAAADDPGVGERVATLLRMGASFQTHGQIKPITGVWQDANGQRFFVIETGERRFWAACLVAVQTGFEHEPTLQVLAVAQPARERQIIENQHAEPPSAVARAREIAAVLLEHAGVFPEGGYGDDYDYFRQALGKRHKLASWRRLNEIMGIDRTYMSRLLKVLKLPTPLLELADQYQVPERVLREIMAVPPRKQEGFLLEAIQRGLTHAEVGALLETSRGAGQGKKRRGKTQDSVQKAARSLRAGLRALLQAEHPQEQIGAVANELVGTSRAPEEALHMAALLEDLAEQVRVRGEAL